MQSKPATKIAFIGTGIMGGHMARRLAQAGYKVSAWNRTPEKSTKLAEFGVVTVDSPSAAVTGADVTIVMLSGGPVVDSVLFEADGTGKIPVECCAKGSTIIVMSTIPVESSKKHGERLAALGLSYLDAPVSGGEKGANEGTLAIFVGGDAAVVEAVAPVFAAMGTATHIGPTGSGQLAKLTNQIIVGISLAGVAEALQFARTGNANIAALRQALLGGFCNSLILRQHGERMVTGNFVPGGPAVYQVRDLVSARELSEQFGMDLPLLKAAEHLFADMVAHGDGDLDHSAVILEVARRSKSV